MRHLALPFYYAAVVRLLLALLVRAIYTGAASFLLPVGAGIAYFHWCGVRDLVWSWPAFREEIRWRAAERQRAPQQADDPQ
ncbi:MULTISPECIES: hypothetical protein [Stenotrophomonas maltophilia group]|uniref:hypothetical protein n=1 Tax=Stenotrophomonas maltophilia group TaxID=995085 RepID=UPI0006AC67B4|nr:hypothetical protein [Stenotrophomonas maltophilia]KOQ67126.1 hypothetical protein ABW42_03245 [Stenotrophomonas maltophilia]MCF3495484.1 hypothetical protein [Stenotrophomonas maltophilia]